MRSVGYIRVSTEDQAKEGISLEHQEAMVKAYASINDLELVEILHDEGASGKDLEREGMAKLLDLVKGGKVEAVIVYKLDRLSRKTLDTLSLIESFESKGVAFHSISEKVDTKSATGKFFLTIISALAQMERIDSRAYQGRTKTQDEKWRVGWPYTFWVQGAEQATCGRP